MKQSLKGLIYHCNLGTWRVSVTLGRINPGDFLILPTPNLGSLHRNCGKGIQKHHCIDSYRLHTCHDHRQNAWKGCLRIVFCANNKDCHIVNNGLISSDFQLCMQPIATYLWVNPSSGKYIHLWANSNIRKVNRIPSLMPPPHALVHRTPRRHYRPPDPQDLQVALT